MRQEPLPDVSSLERGWRVLEWLTQAPGGEARVRELAAALRIPRASLYRVIRTLLEARWIEESPARGAYRLGQGLAALGLAARLSCPLVHAARPVLQEVARESGQMSELVVMVSPARLLALDTWSTARTPVSVGEHVGEAFPLNHIMTHGRCFLFFDGENHLERYLRVAASRENCAARGLTRPPRPETVREDAERSRTRGYVCGWRRYAPELARVAVSVNDVRASRPRMVCSLGIACHPEELTAPRAAAHGMLLRRWARELEARL